MSAESSSADAILNIKPNAIGLNLRVRVLSHVMEVEHTLPDQTKIRFAEFLVGDTSGCIALQVKNDQIEACEVGSIIQIRGAMSYLYEGYLRLKVGKWGTIAKQANSDPSSLVVNMTRNVSSQEFVPTPS